VATASRLLKIGLILISGISKAKFSYIFSATIANNGISPTHQTVFSSASSPDPMCQPSRAGPTSKLRTKSAGSSRVSRPQHYTSLHSSGTFTGPAKRRSQRKSPTESARSTKRRDIAYYSSPESGDRMGRDGSRVAIGQTASVRYLRGGIYVPENFQRVGTKPRYGAYWRTTSHGRKMRRWLRTRRASGHQKQ